MRGYEKKRICEIPKHEIVINKMKRERIRRHQFSAIRIDSTRRNDAKYCQAGAG